MSFISIISIISNKTYEINSIQTFISSFHSLDIIYFIIFILLSIFYYRILKIKDKKIISYSIFGATILTLCKLIGSNIHNFTHIINGYANLFNIIFNLIIFIGYFIIFFSVLFSLFNYLFNKENIFLELQLKSNFFTENTKSFLIIAGIFICCWSIYFIIFFPGIVTWDSYSQITQAMGFVKINNQNPILHTLIMGAFIKLGSIILGNVNLGISFFTVFQMLFCAFTYSLVIRQLIKKNINKYFIIFAFCFYAFHPLIACYSITLWKDIWISNFLILYIIYLIEIQHDKDKFFSS